ncbi:hypothetical protein BCCH1_63150 [Burkholderia contaminans]|uniref:Uncharacterized protein n=2 Tax=Pseudomonadota TaxID=1224 RepID=A0A250LH12_9BURK|nr:hypothetical protein BCCH1_63150 [Burkholderia contaminans]GLZ74574.1 hypothetical protein Bcon01_76190 [Burkholderia contaminans]
MVGAAPGPYGPHIAQLYLCTLEAQLAQETAVPIWRLPSTDEVPNVTLSSWRIFETDAGTRHFVGADVLDSTGRVSSAITNFDRATLRGQTRSGRVYQLVGRDGWSLDAEYVWKRWCTVNDVKSYSDVTMQLLAGTGDDSRT